MVHGPCGTLNPKSLCMIDRKYSKRYPPAVMSKTVTRNDGYPLYKRRSAEDGGNDMTVFGVEPERSDRNAVLHIDEIAKYQAGRYTSSNEAGWRILSFPIHERKAAVVHFAIHLDNGQRVYFTAANVQQIALNPATTMLTNDRHRDACIDAACNTSHSNEILTLFAIILTACSPSPAELWGKSKSHMAEDILHRIRCKNSNINIDAPGGNGKRSLIRLILATNRSQNVTVLALASSGIASTLLSGGRIAHSALKLPLSMQYIVIPTYNIFKASSMGKVLQKGKRILLTVVQQSKFQ
ncbi:unnamed protein product [Onchocerca flexuosa]|uniref:ATP-dependent DNA helicase n=1 Tax=Onchocerca flexuosa TaxID=387005 RepID=A0A183H2U9_9BILA|nr:unnamed protein product [Onchocerca flexuosa]